MSLQTNLAAYVQSPGHVPFATHRGFKNGVRSAPEPFRFVDGELIEKFLECPDAMQLEIVDGLSMELEDVGAMVESLRKMH